MRVGGRPYILCGDVVRRRDASSNVTIWIENTTISAIIIWPEIVPLADQRLMFREGDT